jgi:hypothetical protein
MGNCCSNETKEEVRTTVDLGPMINEQSVDAGLEMKYEEMIRRIPNDHPNIEVVNTFIFRVK